MQSTASDIRAYLEAMTTMRKTMSSPPGMLYSCIEEFVLKHGREFTLIETGPIKRGKMKMCFMNAFHLAENKGLYYTEGYAINPLSPLPLLHAWCVDKHNTVYDPTWEGGTHYYGVAFNMQYVYKTALQRKKYGVIENWEGGFPLLTSHIKDAYLIL